MRLTRKRRSCDSDVGVHGGGFGLDGGEAPVQVEEGERLGVGGRLYVTAPVVAG